MGDRFYDFELVTAAQLDVLPRPYGSIEAWRALDAGRPITLVRPRPDIIAYHLAGTTYLSNVDELAEDLRSLSTGPVRPGELALREVRFVEHGRIPCGLFEPVDGWPLRQLTGFVRADVPLAAALALHIYRSYDGGANVITPAASLIRQVLPSFEAVEESELPSTLGGGPDASIRARIRQAREVLAHVAGWQTRSARDDDSDAAGDAFEAELAALAQGIDLGRELALVLAKRYDYVSPWQVAAERA